MPNRRDLLLQLIDRSAATALSTTTLLTVGVQRLHVVDSDLFTRPDIPQCEKYKATVQRSGECIWHARVVDIVRAVAAATAIQAPAIINAADTQDASLRPALSFRVCNSLTRVLRIFRHRSKGTVAKQP